MADAVVRGAQLKIGIVIFIVIYLSRVSGHLSAVMCLLIMADSDKTVTVQAK